MSMASVAIFMYYLTSCNREQQPQSGAFSTFRTCSNSETKNIETHVLSTIVVIR